VGALAHYLEENGIATTQISLIYEHTRAIRPPRALWVPFALGRPLGVPDNPSFQREVLVSALRLLELDHGPVLEAFPKEAPAEASENGSAGTPWTCPVNLTPAAEEATGPEKRIRSFLDEAAELRVWYDLGVEARGRTAMSDFDPETAAGILCDYLSGKEINPPGRDLPPAVALRLAAQDLKAFYYEAAISRPGAGRPKGDEFADWFWTRTEAGNILRDIRDQCANEQDQALQLTGKMFLVPMGR
jgi:hypothetical protein